MSDVNKYVKKIAKNLMEVKNPELPSNKPGAKLPSPSSVNMSGGGVNKPEKAANVPVPTPRPEAPKTFGQAFKSARGMGKTEFEYKGKKFHTRQKGESQSDWEKSMKSKADIYKKVSDVKTPPVPTARPELGSTKLPKLELPTKAPKTGTEPTLDKVKLPDLKLPTKAPKTGTEPTAKTRSIVPASTTAKTDTEPKATKNFITQSPRASGAEPLPREKMTPSQLMKSGYGRRPVYNEPSKYEKSKNAKAPFGYKPAGIVKSTGFINTVRNALKNIFGK